MSPVRLDPTDPLASVLRWLAALARALGIDPARPGREMRLSRGAAAVVRGWLADWSRQLRAIVHTEAARLARSFHADLKQRGAGAPAAPSRALRRIIARGRLRLAEDPVAASARRFSALRRDAQPKLRPTPDSLLDLEAEAALDRRVRAVLDALRDPSAAVRLLARRLALRRARARAAEAARRRSPSPPRAVGAARHAHVLAPEPRPPDRRAVHHWPAARPAAPAAAA
jgi:hypothetical protein